DRNCSSLLSPRFKLCLPDRPDAWVEDFFEFVALIGIGEYQPGEFLPAQLAVGADEIASKELHDLLKSRPPRFDHLTGNDIGIDNRNAMPLKQRRGGRFSHADAAGKPVGLH